MNNSIEEAVEAVLVEMKVAQAEAEKQGECIHCFVPVAECCCDASGNY